MVGDNKEVERPMQFDTQPAVGLNLLAPGKSIGLLGSE